jgi:uncharacterized protein (DUF362 family)
MDHDSRKDNRITRRDFFKKAAALTGALALVPYLDGIAGAPAKPVVVCVTGTNKEDILKRVMGPLGGIGKFVKGKKVILKPNGGWARAPSVAANTNPDLLVALAKMCKSAGAKEVKMVERPCDTPWSLTFDINKLSEAARKAGVKLVPGSQKSQFRQVSVSKGKVLKRTDVIEDVLGCDVLINVPVLKVHSTTKVTVGLKNLMGIIWDRNAWHVSADLDQCLADFLYLVKPQLTVVDCTVALLSNGPKGPGKTRTLNKVVASTDPVACDAYACSLIDVKASEVPHLAKAARLGHGEIDIAKMTVKKA